MSALPTLAEALRASPGIAHKRDIARVARALAGDDARIAVGDDCAAIPQPDGSWLLFAIEGFINGFVAREPWFAGWCGVMVNLSDIAAMGGRPLAVCDALWGRDDAHLAPVLEGLAAAAQAYGVPIVGGHTNGRSPGGEQLAVSVLGRANRLLSSFAARPGDSLLAAIDLRGRFHEPDPFWDAATGGAPASRLRGDLEVLPQLAEAGLCHAAKDISMGGLAGTALMLLECSGVGAVIDLAAVPAPPGVPRLRWLQAFPSFGFLLAVESRNVAAVCGRFAARDIACAEIGRCDDSRRLRITDETGGIEILRDLATEPLMGFGPGRANRPESAHA